MKTILPFFVFCILSYNTGAQSWTWVNGDQGISSSSSYGSIGIESPDNKPPGRNLAASWIDKKGNLWVFGGSHDYTFTTPMFNDLWRYNPSNNQWAWMGGDSVLNTPGVYGTQGVPSPQNKPGGRNGAAYWTDKDGNFWLFGGNYNYGGLDFGGLNDLWKYDPVTNLWTWVKGSNERNALAVFGTQSIPDINNMPGATNIATCWTDKKGNLWFFGGFSFRTTGTYAYRSNNLWRYDPSTNIWTWMKGNQTTANAVYGTQGIPANANTPSVALMGTSWVDKDGNLWLFGGEDFNNKLNDLWKYDPLINMWTWVRGDKSVVPVGSNNIPTKYGTQGVADITNTPGGRLYGASWTDGDDNLWQFGGFGSVDGYSLGALNDLWKYNIPTNSWTWIKGDTIINPPGVYGILGVADPLNIPPGRSLACSWKDSLGNNWLFGGNHLNDLWKIGSTSFSPVTQLTLHAEAVQENILVGWETTREVNTGNFILERSADSINFSFLNTSPAAGNSNTIRVYSYLDVSPLPETNYYRLKIVNTNGSFFYSNIVSVKINKPPVIFGPAILYPNPATDIISIHLNGSNENMLLDIFDATGRKLITEEFIVNGDTRHEIKIRHLPAAVYFLKLRSPVRSFCEKFVKL